jgi:hypothetical protein
MFTDIKEGLNVYKKEVSDYLIWVKTLGLEEGDVPMAALDNHNWGKMLEWNAKMKGMAEALGLKEMEVTIIDMVLGAIKKIPDNLLDGITVRDKSEWQKDNCLFCENPATKEAVYDVSTIRCCDNSECQEEAKKTSLRPVISKLIK